MLGWGFLFGCPGWLAFLRRNGLLSSMDKFTEIKQREAKSRKRTMRIREKGTVAERQKEQERNSLAGGVQWEITNWGDAFRAASNISRTMQVNP